MLGNLITARNVPKWRYRQTQVNLNHPAPGSGSSTGKAVLARTNLAFDLRPELVIQALTQPVPAPEQILVRSVTDRIYRHAFPAETGHCR